MLKCLASRIILAGIFLVAGVSSSFSQSTSQNYPTPLTTNEINGEVTARDIGDARLTTYFYTFNGTQGDMFVNVVSKNFNGSFDIFTSDNLQPLTKILVYADNSESETGRVLYLRKPEKLLLRVEGRSPNDDPATYTLKFAGGFVAAADTGEEAPALPEVKVSDTSRTRVNSVGTVLERIPKKKPAPKAEIASSPKEKTGGRLGEDVARTEETPAKVVEKPSVEETAKTEAKPDEETAKKDEPKTDTATTSRPENEDKKVEVVVTDSVPGPTSESSEAKKTAANRGRTRKAPVKKEPAQTSKTDTETVSACEPKTSEETKTNAAAPPATSEAKTEDSLRTLISPKRKKTLVASPKAAAPDPLANIHLLIELKDGSKIEKPMSEVVRFAVDRGVLTVSTKDGATWHFPILDVLRTTIQ